MITSKSFVNRLQNNQPILGKIALNIFFAPSDIAMAAEIMYNIEKTFFERKFLR